MLKSEHPAPATANIACSPGLSAAAQALLQSSSDAPGLLFTANSVQHVLLTQLEAKDLAALAAACKELKALVYNASPAVWEQAAR